MASLPVSDMDRDDAPEHSRKRSQSSSSTSGEYRDEQDGNRWKNRTYGRLPTTSRATMNEYFVPKEGIDREVITADICRYLGNDALVRPGKYENPQTREAQAGYFISAYRNLTTTMIADLRADSERWEAERRQTSSRGQLANVHYPDSHTHQTRQYYGPTDAGESVSSGTQYQQQQHAYASYQPAYASPTDLYGCAPSFYDSDSYPMQVDSAAMVLRSERPVVRARTPPIRYRAEVAAVDSTSQRREESFAWVGSAVFDQTAATEKTDGQSGTETGDNIWAENELRMDYNGQLNSIDWAEQTYNWGEENVWASEPSNVQYSTDPASASKGSLSAPYTTQALETLEPSQLQSSTTPISPAEVPRSHSNTDQLESRGTETKRLNSYSRKRIWKQLLRKAK